MCACVVFVLGAPTGVRVCLTLCCVCENVCACVCARTRQRTSACVPACVVLVCANACASAHEVVVAAGRVDAEAGAAAGDSAAPEVLPQHGAHEVIAAAAVPLIEGLQKRASTNQN